MRLFAWFHEISAGEKRAFWACFGGWTLDSMDVQMYSLVIPALLVSWKIGHTRAGALAAAALLSSAIGGSVAGFLADRYGRARILQFTILWYSVFTFLCAFAQSFEQLLVFRVLQGLGFGGEWAAGAVLMGEMIRPEHRGKAVGTVQSGWAVGWGAAVLLSTLLFSVLPHELAWRVLFGIGLLPAAFVFYVRSAVGEPAAYAERRRQIAEGSQREVRFLDIFAPGVVRQTLLGALLGTGSHGGYAALMTWLPTYLRTERGLSIADTGASLFVVIGAAWLGYIASAHLADWAGRRTCSIAFAVACVATILLYLGAPISAGQMLLLGFPLGFFSAGIPAVMGPLFTELFPGPIRGTAQGFCYNFGRATGALFPVAVGALSRQLSLGTAVAVFASAAYCLVVAAAVFLPETRGRALVETMEDVGP